MHFIVSLKNFKKCSVYDPVDYKIADDTILQPDILVVCKEILKNYLDFPPALVVEILSLSTALRDRNTKFDIYEKQGINYYLIVDPDKKTVEVYQMHDDKYSLVDSEDNNYTFLLDGDYTAVINTNDIW